MVELVSHDDDLDSVDFKMVELYWLMKIWYKQATDAMDRIHANDIHTWIALDKPSFQDLLQNNEHRAYIVFSALSRMKAMGDITEPVVYQSDILSKLKDVYKWRDAESVNIPLVSSIICLYQNFYQIQI